GVDSAGGAASPRCLRIDPLRSEGGENRCYRGRTRTARSLVFPLPQEGRSECERARSATRGGSYVRLASPAPTARPPSCGRGCSLHAVQHTERNLHALILPRKAGSG